LDKSWITHTTQQPIAGDFGSTKGQGSPIAINNSDGTAWYLPKASNTPAILSSTSTEVYPESFGAKRDGTTDDVLAIQAAINLQVSRGGGRVKLRPGTYYCSTALTWNGAPVELAGSGNTIQPNGGTVLKFPTGLNGCVIVQNGPAGLGSQSCVRNFIIQGQAVRICTISVASPGVVTLANHGFANNTKLTFISSGAIATSLPAPLVIGTDYFVRNPTTNTFELSATSGGASINTTAANTGTIWVCAQITDADADAGVGAGLVMQCNGGRVEDVTCMYHAGNGTMILSAYPGANVAINANNSKVNGLSNYWNGKNGFAIRGVDSNNCLFGLIDCTYNGQYGMYENSFLGNVASDLHTAGNTIGSVRYGDITRCNRLTLYKEIGTALVIQIEAGGAGSNIFDLRLVEGDTLGTITINDLSGTGNNMWAINNIQKLGMFGTAYPGVGMVRLSDTGVDVRKGAYIALLNPGETETWIIQVNAAGKLLIQSPNVANEVNFAGNPVVMAELNVNTSTGVQVQGVPVLKTRQAIIGNASHCAGPGSPTKAEYDGTVDIVNTIIARLGVTSGHGLTSD
jgi:hypothetical protein